MKIRQISKWLIFTICIALTVILIQSCATVEEKPPKVIDNKLLSCCPDGGGILDSLINNAIDSTNEYAPYVQFGNSQDVLWFTTSREREFKDKKKTYFPGEIMYSTRPASMRKSCPNQGWSAAQRFTTSDEAFERWTRGTVAFLDGSMIIAAESPLGSNIPAEANGTSFNLDLWELRDVGGKYDNPVIISDLNSPYWESQPCVSPDGKMLLFVSNRPRPDENAGPGDKNIWYSVKKAGKWAEPKMLNTVNTKGDDISPHWGVDGKFYFATNWSYVNDAPSAANFDIFVCESFKDSEYGIIPSDPMNINSLSRKSACGPQSQINVNTSANEMFPFITPDKKAIYWSSDKNGGYGKLDIFACGLPDPCIKLIASVRRRLLDNVNGKLVIVEDYKIIPDFKLKLSGAVNKTITTEMEEVLEPGKTYQLSMDVITENCFDCSCKPLNYNIETSINDTIIRLTFDCDCIRRKRQEVTLAGGHVPFFITGYWWPSTSENIAEFKNRRGKGGFDTTFIDSRDYDYFNPSTGTAMDNFFEEKIYKKLEKIADELSNCGGDDILNISVRGYTDECRLMPGKYTVDETINVGDVIIPQGWEMRNTWAQTTTGKKINLPDGGQQGNIMLSKLRAYYTYKTIDNAMKKRSSSYKTLADKGQVKFDYEGYGIYDKNQPCKNDTFETAGANLTKDPAFIEKCNDPLSRRISMFFELIPKSHEPYYKLTRCGDAEQSYLRFLKGVQEPLPDETEQSDETSKSKKPEDGGSAGCTGPNCYQISYGIVGSLEEFDSIHEFLSKLNIEVMPEKMEDGRVRIISERLTEENAKQQLAKYSQTIENFVLSIVKKIEFKAEIIKIGS